MGPDARGLGGCGAGNTGTFSSLCFSFLGEIATDPTSREMVRVEEVLEVGKERSTYETVIFWESLRANEPWKCGRIARQHY